MVDNRSAGFSGIGGSFNFKSGDISGTAAKTQDDKMDRAVNTFRKEKKTTKKNLKTVKNILTEVRFSVLL